MPLLLFSYVKKRENRYGKTKKSSYKSIIGKNRLIVGGVATKKEGQIKVVFHSPSNVSQISATVSGIVEKNDFGSFVSGDYFEGNDYAFLYDGTKNRATL